jgi:hypothetical protein
MAGSSSGRITPTHAGAVVGAAGVVAAAETDDGVLASSVSE